MVRPLENLATLFAPKYVGGDLFIHAGFSTNFRRRDWMIARVHKEPDQPLNVRKFAPGGLMLMVLVLFHTTLGGVAITAFRNGET
jgi:hypothetical protein